jgi:hypothetical protein
MRREEKTTRRRIRGSGGGAGVAACGGGSSSSSSGGSGSGSGGSGSGSSSGSAAQSGLPQFFGEKRPISCVTEKNTKKAIPIPIRGLPELISKSGSPRIGMGFIPIWGPTYTHMQIRRYAIHRYTDTQIHRYTDTQIRRYADTQMRRYTDTHTQIRRSVFWPSHH